MHRKREEAAQVALKIACRIRAKPQPVFVKSPDFALAESLPNLRAKANAGMFLGRARQNASHKSRQTCLAPKALCKP